MQLMGRDVLSYRLSGSERSHSRSTSGEQPSLCQIITGRLPQVAVLIVSASQTPGDLVC
jgi:hypothetical protein